MQFLLMPLCCKHINRKHALTGSVYHLRTTTYSFPSIIRAGVILHLISTMTRIVPYGRQALIFIYLFLGPHAMRSHIYVRDRWHSARLTTCIFRKAVASSTLTKEYNFCILLRLGTDYMMIISNKTGRYWCEVLKPQNLQNNTSTCLLSQFNN